MYFKNIINFGFIRIHLKNSNKNQYIVKKHPLAFKTFLTYKYILSFKKQLIIIKTRS